MSNSKPLKQQKEINNYYKEIDSVIPKEKPAALQMAMLIEYVDTIEKQLNLATSQLQEVNKQLQLLQQGVQQKEISKIVKDVNTDMSVCKNYINDIKDNIITIIQKSLNNLKTQGVLAFNKITEVMKLSETLIKLSDTLDSSIKKTNTRINRINLLSADFRETSALIKNFSNKLLGKDNIIAKKEQQGFIAKNINKCLNNILKLQNKILTATITTFCKVDDLHIRSTLLKDNEKSISSTIKENKKGINISPKKPKIEVSL